MIESLNSFIRWFAPWSLLAVVLTACQKKSPPAATVEPRIRPFDFQVQSGTGVFQIDGYIALVPSPGRKPALLIVNPETGNARRCIQSSLWLSSLDIQVACISLPGSGASSGPGRWVGPQAVLAVRRALSLLAERSDVDPSRLAVWGSANGALAAGLAMDFQPQMRAIILQSGTYDMLRLWPVAPLMVKLKILHQVWPSRKALDERSVLAHLPARLNLSVLILHGENDRQSPASQAKLLEEALKERGAYVKAYYFADAGHQLGNRVDQLVKEFLRERLLGES